MAVLRDTDYQGVKAAIYDLPGVRFTTAERLLAPNAGFARSVLPAVRAEMAAQLDGVAGWSVLAVDPAGGTIGTLVEEAPKPGSTVAVGLDRAVQSAAEDAVEPVSQQAMLVARGALDRGHRRGRAERTRRRGRGARAGRPVPARLHLQDRDGDGGRRRAAAHRGLPGGLPGQHGDRRPPGAQRGPLRPGHGPAAHRVRPLLQHHVRRARRGARAGLVARGGAAARVGRRLRGARADHRHRVGAGRAGPGAARRERLRAGPGAGQPAGHGAGRGHRGARRPGRPAADPRPAHRGPAPGRHRRTRPRSTRCAR